MKPGLIKHDTAGAFIISTDQPRKALLVHHRKYGVWLQPGGHQKSGENPVEAAIREVKEETGLDVASLMPAAIELDAKVNQLPSPDYLLEENVPAVGAEPAHVHLDHLYVITMPEQSVRHDALESHAIGWYTSDQLDDLPMLENTRMLLKQELAK